MHPRAFGRSGISLSPITFGSMRLDPNRTPMADAVALFHHLSIRGVTTFHSSFEYASFPYFCDVLAAFRRERPSATIRHIVKLPAPHFDEPRFSTAAFDARVERYRSALKADRLDVVQWLVRQDPNTTESRCRVLRESGGELCETWTGLRDEGKVGALASFPYDPAFAEVVLANRVCDGLATYLNPAELEYADFVDRTPFIAIRPLFAGMLTEEGLQRAYEEPDREERRSVVLAALNELGVSVERAADFGVRYGLLHPSVSSTIAGISTIEHANTLLDAIDDLEPSPKAFAQTTQVLKAARQEAAA